MIKGSDQGFVCPKPEP